MDDTERFDRQQRILRLSKYSLQNNEIVGYYDNIDINYFNKQEMELNEELHKYKYEIDILLAKAEKTSSTQLQGDAMKFLSYAQKRARREVCDKLSQFYAFQNLRQIINNNSTSIKKYEFIV